MTCEVWSYTSTRYPTVDYESMSLLSELAEELSVTSMSVWYEVSASVFYESIYDESLQLIYLVRCLFFKRCLLWSNTCKTLLGKHVDDYTTTKHCSNEHVTDLGDSELSAFKQTRHSHLMYDSRNKTYN